MRKLFFPMLWIGLSVAVLTGRQELSEVASAEELFGQFQTTGDLIGALFSPLAPLILAFGVRIAVSFLAMGLAYPLTLWNQRTDYPTSRGSGSRRRMWVDRLNLTKAYRALRWTWAVRDVAVKRSGRRGPALVKMEQILVWANPSLFVVLVLWL